MLENYTRTEEGKYHQGQCSVCLGGLLPEVPSPALKPWSLKVPDTECLRTSCAPAAASARGHRTHLLRSGLCGGYPEKVASTHWI